MKYSYSVYLTAATLAAICSPISAHSEDVIGKWESSAAAGLTLTRGNSDTLLATLGLTTSKKWNQNELAMGIDATYGSTKQSEANNPPPGSHEVTHTTAQSVHGAIQYNRLFTAHWYGYAKVDALHDEVADIRYRVLLSPGVGYYFIKTKATELSAEVGPGYIIERLGTNDHSYATLRVGEKFKQELSDRARLWQSAEWLPQVDKFDNYIINFELGVEADLSSSKKLSLRAVFQDTYNNQPAPHREKNDAKLVTAIAYKF